MYNVFVNQFFGITENTLTLGYKAYELSNHLGNVLTTISDNYFSQNSTAEVSARVLSSQDYFPFGMVMTERSFQEKQERKYRWGFNGKENDEDLEGQDYGFRIYRENLGKFLSVDPLSAEYPFYTPYSFAGNMPIVAIDLDGGEVKVTAHNFGTLNEKYQQAFGKKCATYKDLQNNLDFWYKAVMAQGLIEINKKGLHQLKSGAHILINTPQGATTKLIWMTFGALLFQNELKHSKAKQRSSDGNEARLSKKQVQELRDYEGVVKPAPVESEIDFVDVAVNVVGVAGAIYFAPFAISGGAIVATAGAGEILIWGCAFMFSVAGLDGALRGEDTRLVEIGQYVGEKVDGQNGAATGKQVVIGLDLLTGLAGHGFTLNAWDKLSPTKQKLYKGLFLPNDLYAMPTDCATAIEEQILKNENALQDEEDTAARSRKSQPKKE